MEAPIYLDHHATTPLDPRVLEGMLPYLRAHFGNAASRNHVFGRTAAAAVEEARERVARAIGARPADIVFTAGATEANALALRGLAGGEAPHLVTTAIEHRSVLDNARRLEREGWALTVLPVDGHGCVDPERLQAALRPQTRLVSVLAANNEIGTLQPLAALGAIVRGSQALFHVDATQALGRVPLDVEVAGIDLLSLSAHKAYGPKGVGALYRRRRPRRVALTPLYEGGGQEDGLRPGTLNVAGIVDMGQACELAVHEMASEAPRLRALRQRLLARLEAALDGLRVNGHPEQRLAGSLHLSVDGIDADALLRGLDEVALSAGAACSSGLVKPSHVLQAIGATGTAPAATLRLCVGRFNTEAEIDRAAARIVQRVQDLRAHARSDRGG